jgi:hypothetical protein
VPATAGDDAGARTLRTLRDPLPPSN